MHSRVHIAAGVNSDTTAVTVSMHPNMRRLMLASVGTPPKLGRQERTVKHDVVIFGQLEVKRRSSRSMSRRIAAVGRATRT